MFKNIITNILMASKVNNLKVASIWSMYQPNLKDMED